MTSEIRLSQNVHNGAMFPDLQSMETIDLCALYEAALALDGMAIAWSNMPRYQIESEAFPSFSSYTPAGDAVVAWSTFYSDMRDAIAAELEKRPVTDQTFMVLVEHVTRYGDDPTEVLNITAGLLARRDAVSQAAE